MANYLFYYYFIFIQFFDINLLAKEDCEYETFYFFDYLLINYFLIKTFLLVLLTIDLTTSN